MLPFTQSEFFAVFAAYNQAVWPAQVVAYFVAGVPLLALTRPAPVSERGMLIVSAAMWGWTGVAYHWVFFSGINKAAYPFGAAFAIQAALLLFAAARRERVALRFSGNLSATFGTAFIAYATVLYPLIGWLSGHRYPSAPMFGITPCPVTIFTFGVFLLSRHSVPWWLLVIPVAWSLIGGSAAVLLSVPQDWVLFLSGAVTLIVLRWRKAIENDAAPVKA